LFCCDCCWYVVVTLLVLLIAGVKTSSLEPGVNVTLESILLNGVLLFKLSTFGEIGEGG